MFYKLMLQNHVDGLAEKQWTFRPPAVVGRDPACDVCFDHDSISRQHCQFSLNGEGALQVKDLESMNGIYVDDRRVPHAILMPHQTLQIGALILQVEFSEDEAPSRSVKPQGSTYATQPMQTFRPAATTTPVVKKTEPDKPWWRRLFE